MLSYYDSRTAETRNKMMGSRTSYQPNKYYKSAQGDFYYYINSRGYYHIIKPIKIRYNGIIHHYEIKDYLLTEDNFLKVHGFFGCFKNAEEVIRAIEENLADEIKA